MAKTCVEPGCDKAVYRARTMCHEHLTISMQRSIERLIPTIVSASAKCQFPKCTYPSTDIAVAHGRFLCDWHLNQWFLKQTLQPLSQRRSCFLKNCFNSPMTKHDNICQPHFLERQQLLIADAIGGFSNMFRPERFAETCWAIGCGQQHDQSLQIAYGFAKLCGMHFSQWKRGEALTAERYVNNPKRLEHAFRRKVLERAIDIPLTGTQLNRVEIMRSGGESIYAIAKFTGLGVLTVRRILARIKDGSLVIRYITRKVKIPWQWSELSGVIVRSTETSNKEDSNKRKQANTAKQFQQAFGTLSRIAEQVDSQPTFDTPK